MRNELEMFQKKNNDQSQAIEVEMFPGMSAGGCDFSQDAAIKSISNIGAAKAMQIIAKVKAEKKQTQKLPLNRLQQQKQKVLRYLVVLCL